MIRLDQISVSLPGSKGRHEKILKNITLNIPRGDWLLLAGPNGSGKSTLLQAIAGIHTVDEGSMAFDGNEEPADCGRSLKFAVMFQDPDDQFAAGSVKNELFLSAWSSGGGRSVGSAKNAAERSAVEKRVGEAVDMYSLGSFLDNNPHDLSAGEKQMLAMASVWLSDPECLLLDEPLSFLDGEAKTRCIRFVREMNGRGITIIWASPGGDEMIHAKSFACLDHGELKFHGGFETFMNFLRKNDIAVRLPRILEIGREFGQIICNKTGACDNSGLSERTFEDLNTAGSEKGEISRGGEKSPARCPVELDSVFYAYNRGDDVIRNLSFSVGRGECLGITGNNGSGKTTLIELAAGVIKPRAGRITSNTGVHHRGKGRGGSDKQGKVFYLMQSPEKMLFAETVFEELAFGLRNIGVRTEKIFSKASHALSLAGLDFDLLFERSPVRMSFGEKRRLALAIALSLDPALVFFDEPSACLDRGGLKILISSIWLLRSRGAASVICSHDVDFLAEICDRVLFLREGRIADSVEIVNGRMSESSTWPSYCEKPLVLELQDFEPSSGSRVGRPELSAGGFIRSIFAHSETDVF